MKKRAVIIIVSWNTREILHQCLLALAKQTTGPVRVDVVVVDNASTDGSADMVKNDFPAVTLLRMGSNLGFARANNVALRYLAGPACAYDHVLFLNSDVIVSDRAVQDILNVLDRSPGAGAAGPALVLPDGAYQVGAAGHRIGVLSVFLYSTFLHLFLPLKAAKGMYLDQRRYASSPSPVSVGWVSGACMCVRSDVLELTGPWDEQNFMYAEDVELCERIRRHGWDILYIPAVQVLHHHGASSRDQAEPNTRWIPALFMYLKRYRRPHEYMLIRAMLICGMFLRLFLYGAANVLRPGGGAKQKMRELYDYIITAVSTSNR